MVSKVWLIDIILPISDLEYLANIFGQFRIRLIGKIYLYLVLKYYDL